MHLLLMHSVSYQLQLTGRQYVEMVYYKQDAHTHTVYWLAVWLSGNALASINVVALRQTRLVPGWVTVCGRVNHLGM